MGKSQVLKWKKGIFNDNRFNLEDETRESDRQTDRQTNGWIHGQTDLKRDKQTENSNKLMG